MEMWKWGMRNGMGLREWGEDNGWMWESGKMKENEGRVVFSNKGELGHKSTFWPFGPMHIKVSQLLAPISKWT
jgi:hypothetical protein